MSRAPPLLLALVATSCSLLFPVEPYATGTDGGTGSAGGAAGNAASFLLVARDSRDTFIATFADGALTGVERGPGLSAAGSGIGRLDGEALAINDSGLSRAPRQSLTAWQTASTASRPSTGGMFAITTHGVLSGPGNTSSQAVYGAGFSGVGLEAWRTVGMLGQRRTVPTVLAHDRFVLVIGGREFGGRGEVPSSRVELAALGAGPQLAAFAQTTSLPRGLDEPAVTLADDELYVCGGRTDQGTANDCHVAAVSATGALQPFRALADLPNGMSGGALVKLGRRLHLLGASNQQIPQHRALIFTLELDASPGAWTRQNVRLPAEVELAQAVQLTP